nr:serine hydrolase domain-containing protein [Rhodohalobacter mucosus]
MDDSTARYYGAIRTADTLKNMSNSESVFEIGSISKVFTSTLLAHASVEGGINPDEPIRNYLETEMKDSAEFTFMQLSNHTSGLPRLPPGFIWNMLLNTSNPYAYFGEEDLITYLREDVELEYEPGEEHAYSNLGAGLLGYALEQAEGASYEELLNRHIFRPLGMTRSTTVQEGIQQYLVPGLDKRGRETSNWDLNVLQGAGAIYSTAHDLSRFALANFDPSNEVYALERQTTFSNEEENLEIAMGWIISTRSSGDRWYWHNGGTGGYRTIMVISPENNRGVIVLSNISAGHSEAAEIDRLGFDLMGSLSDTDQ